ncbi:MAG: 3-isopropylmalate dehydratase large subunit [Pseudomonadota bacterium]
MTAPLTLFDKLWDRHVVRPETDDSPAVVYIDLHLIHEVTSPQAFGVLRDRGLKVRRPDRTFATLDHSTPTLPKRADGSLPFATEQAAAQVDALIRNANEHGITLFGLDDPRRGIVHVIGPELGLTQPGKTIVCGDSHTSTHGAFGALAFGIGTTEVGHVLATQCLLLRKPKAIRIRFDGALSRGVTAKDMALAAIASIGADGGQGKAIEFSGPAVEGLSMAGRMTLCNMSIEAGARVGLVAPDQTTFDYLKGRDYAPKASEWDKALEDWSSLATDPDAVFHEEFVIDAAAITPMVTFGTSPDAAAPVGGMAPEDGGRADEAALSYMNITPGKPFAEVAVDKVFIGSCTNSRLEDLEAAAAVFRGRKVSDGVKALVVPGSEAVKREAEQKGLHDVFVKAGAEWRAPGCSMCIAMNGDKGSPGELVVSTSNRNFVGRQGAGVRTVLAGPATAAAAAVSGRLVDPRRFLEEV